MKFFRTLCFLTLTIIIASCSSKSEHTETDNLFKFKEYISYNTYGNQSVTTEITVGLAQPLEQFDLTQELTPSEYLDISPKTPGRLVIKNGNTLIFVPSENLKSDTEYLVTVKLEKRSEEHTSELQSRPHLVCRLLLEKK